MTDRDLTRLSRFLSLVLRHKPEEIGITLDPQGWVRVGDLLGAMKAVGRPLTRQTLEQIVSSDQKGRYVIERAGHSGEGDRIRACQGHSVAVDLGLVAAEPPEFLFHGTVRKYLKAIAQEGLIKGKRQYVHLSPDPETATQVGSRRGEAVVLMVQARRMHADGGHAFYRSTNGVWLTDGVPPRYLIYPSLPTAID
jgi:putative RNA 2'-phosphotransferase